MSDETDAMALLSVYLTVMVLVPVTTMPYIVMLVVPCVLTPGIMILPL